MSADIYFCYDINYQTTNISCTLVGNKIVDHSNVSTPKRDNITVLLVNYGISNTIVLEIP